VLQDVVSDEDVPAVVRERELRQIEMKVRGAIRFVPRGRVSDVLLRRERRLEPLFR
jgi:hypothetical protein